MGFARGCRGVRIGPRRARTLRIERGAGFPEQERSETTEHEQCTQYHERGRAPPASTTAPISEPCVMPPTNAPVLMAANAEPYRLGMITATIMSSAPITDMISMNTFSLFSNHFFTTPGPVEVATHSESP